MEILLCHHTRSQCKEYGTLHAYSVIMLRVIQAAILLQIVREHYDHFAKQDATLRVSFSNSKITLDIPKDGLGTAEGWRITPFTHPTVSQACMDHQHNTCIIKLNIYVPNVSDLQE